ncbi:hypothetical protein NG800_012740 [Epilithonimonas ginsengisoli]|uniref:DoxX family protein n=1 Tax=Epilithonimonas ginsengisoli TaxID=1245592 RepID=A0ABU4JJB8_9FLAO|nr:MULTISPECIES: hypothetical protein [Chryseobacterium group]MBV6880894.1 hypothetical protein [Epilithonimonas sp. FP105]MDW8549784.1 hypothetical protein [Epilithonimonas ginsengisoli]OAH66545.1 hypothetical protein AXA65_17650 [Chryseobacterium sp. FP211-J200]
MNSYQEKVKYIFYWTIIFVVAGSMIVYGISKPVQFQSFKDATNLNVSEGHKLMWTFYSYSLIYPIIIGVFEVIGGILLLLNRTRVLGCILLTVILSNIILQDYVYEITALNSAIYYQILVLIILIFDFKKVKKIIDEVLRSEKTNRNMALMILALVIAILFKYFETKII